MYYNTLCALHGNAYTANSVGGNIMTVNLQPVLYGFMFPETGVRLGRDVF